MPIIDGDTKSGFEGERICGNCQSFVCPRNESGTPKRKDGICRNGISGKMQTTISQGCGHGFYPCTIRWPLKAGPGGVFG